MSGRTVAGATAGATTAQSTTGTGDAPAPAPAGGGPGGDTAAELGRLRRGSSYLSMSAFVIGGLNYLFALLLTRLLSSGEYSVFAAGQALLLTVGTIATSAVPWVLARQLVLAGDDHDLRRSAVSFAVALNLAAGLVVGAITTAIALRFATPWGALATGLGSLLIFSSTNVVGWAQGEERWLLLAGLRSGEVVVKAVAGLVLVGVGLGATGGLAGFAVGSGMIVLSSLWLMRRDLRPRFVGLRSPDLWRTAGGISVVQGLVAVLSSVDVVVVASLPTSPEAAGSYQATMIIARIPLFLSAAGSLAVFTLLARGRDQAVFVAAAIRSYVLLALPLLLALLTIPRPVLSLVFPPGYGDVHRFLPWLAVSGFAIGAVNLLTTFFQATSRYGRSAAAQGAGLAVTVVGIVVGWATGGLLGVAVGAMAGALVAATLLLAVGRRTWRSGVRVSLGYLPPFALLAVLLVLLRPLPVLWTALAVVVGAGCAYRVFFRGATHPARPTGSGDRPQIVHLGFEDVRRPGSGGGAVRTHEVNRRLADRFDITVLTTSWPGCEDRVEDGVRYVHIGWGRGYFPSILTYFARLPSALRRHPADLVVEDFAAPFSSALSPLYAKAPVLALVQWLNAKEKSAQYHLPFHRVERLGLRLHDRYVVVSEGMAEAVLAGHPGAEVTVVANGIDPLAFEAEPRDGEDIVFVGRLEVAQKGLDLLLEAFAQVRDRVPGRLVLVGDGQDEQRVRRTVERLGLGDRVELAGRLDGREKFERMAGARVVAMTSRYETFGIVAVEALASGTPVVAFDIPCLREVVPPEVGCLVPAFDVTAFGEALVGMDADPERARLAGARGREFARRFEWPAIAEQQGAVYARLLADRADDESAASQPPSTSR